MVHEEYKEMILARALSALDAAEDRALTEHLSGCAECQRELEESQRTAASLALVVEPMEPSPKVREQILARIKEDGHQSADPSRVIQFPAARKNVWSSVGSLGAIAAAILFVALIISVIVLWRQNQTMQARLDAMSRDLIAATADLRKKEQAERIVMAPGARMSELAGTNMAPTATAKLTYDRNGHAMLFTEGLPVAPEGREYQLWFIVDGKPMPGKVFKPDSTGKAMMEDEVPSEALNSAVFAVTLEPAGANLKAPTGKIYLASSS